MDNIWALRQACVFCGWIISYARTNVSLVLAMTRHEKSRYLKTTTALRPLLVNGMSWGTPRSRKIYSGNRWSMFSEVASRYIFVLVDI